MVSNGSRDIGDGESFDSGGLFNVIHGCAMMLFISNDQDEEEVKG